MPWSTALGCAFCMPLFVSLWHRPQRGVLALLALVPFNGLLVIFPHPGIVEGWKEGVVGLTVVAAGAMSLRTRGTTASAQQRRVVPSWAALTAALIGLALVYAAAAPSKLAIVGLKVDFFYVLIPLVLWWHPFSSRERDHVVSILMATGFITAVVGLGQQIVGPAALVRLGYRYNVSVRTIRGHLRSFSTFDQPFPFALFVMVVLLVCIPVALEETSRRRNRWFLAATPVILVGMLTAIVRAAVLGLLAGLVYLAIARYRSLGRVFALGMIALLLLPAGASAVFTSRSSLDDRTTGWSVVVDLVAGRPLGYGVGTVGAAAEKATGHSAGTGRSAAESASIPYQPDNYYLKVVLEIGLVGLWIFVSLLLTAFSHARRLADARDGR